MKVLYLTEWYPHRYDAMPGLFVRKHAQAAAGAGADVCVLYFQPDPKAAADTEVVASEADGLHEVTVYFRRRYLDAVRTGWTYVRSHWGMPQLTQLNVLTKNGLLAYWLRLRYGIPYILVEHWSGYLPENGSFRGGWHGALMRFIAHCASAILPVSQALEDGMKQAGIRNLHWERIHNVVEEAFYEGCRVQDSGKKVQDSGFRIQDSGCRLQEGCYRFLHVSCFDERSKNTQGIVRAVKLLSEKRQDFCFRMVGTGPDIAATRQLAMDLGLREPLLRFEGEKTPMEVHEAMQTSDCFVLFSRYENAPVVLSESMASGLPIIATRVGGIPEMVDEETGILVTSENETELAEAMEQMMRCRDRFDEPTIRRRAEVYRMQNIGKFLLQTYEKYAAR